MKRPEIAQLGKMNYLNTPAEKSWLEMDEGRFLPKLFGGIV